MGSYFDWKIDMVDIMQAVGIVDVETLQRYIKRDQDQSVGAYRKNLNLPVMKKAV